MPDAHAGEVPVCYVALRPGRQATLQALMDHAQQRIAERPAWPRHIVVLDEIPLTAVGKPYKPRLRCDAARRGVERFLTDELGLSGAHVVVREGGARGLQVQVSLPAAQVGAQAAVQAALARFVFEAQVVAA
jgi:fatty-acyl-CoA synthase